MTAWAAFAGATGLVLTLLIVLARTSQRAVEPSTAGRSENANEAAGRDGPAAAVGTGGEDDPHSLSSGLLLVNVAATQGLFGAVLVAAAWLAEVPAHALGLGRLGGFSVFVGVALGVALYVANEGMAAFADDIGIEYAEELRELLAPDSAAGWALLLVVVLPVIAGFEEVLFRAALIGAMSVGFAVSPWLLAVGSTVLFALGHGAQGTAGIVVTGALGFALAAAFILTESLLVVVVAHYLVNALEFVVHEGLGVEWTGATSG